MENKTTIINPDNLRLYNRYRIDVRLVRENSETEPDVYTLMLPEQEQQWCQFSYDYETEAHEDCLCEEISESEKKERYCSIDPSGGPYIALGPNVISLWPSGTIRMNVFKIYEDSETKHWRLKVDNLTIE